MSLVSPKVLEERSPNTIVSAPPKILCQLTARVRCIARLNRTIQSGTLIAPEGDNISLLPMRLIYF
jgi:hypothetical protein